jgi:hypothetical protein
MHPPSTQAKQKSSGSAINQYQSVEIPDVVNCAVGEESELLFISPADIAALAYIC